jgi:hypothetical protein
MNPPFDDFELESIRQWKENQGKNIPVIPSAKVQEHFRRLETIRQAEGMDLAKALDLLEKWRNEEARR